MCRNVSKALAVYSVTTVVAGISMALATEQSEPSTYAYVIGKFHTENGRLLALPPGTTGVNCLWYFDGGASLFVNAYGTDQETGKLTTSGWWTLERASGQYSKIQDNVTSPSTRQPLSRLTAARISPNGRWLTGISEEYAETVRSVSFRDDRAVAECIKSAMWVAIDRDTMQRTVVKDLTDESRSLAPSWTPHELIWIDNTRIVFTRQSSTSDGRPRATIYLADASSGVTQELIREAVGADVAGLRYVDEGKFIYYVQDPASLNTILSAPPGEKVKYLNKGLTLRLSVVERVDPSIRTLPLLADSVALREGTLSPDEKFYAFVRPNPSQNIFSICIVNVESGQMRQLPNEAFKLCQWHPDGTKLLGYMSPTYPQDPKGVIVELPVGPILATLK